jgi:hypothetical protein
MTTTEPLSRERYDGIAERARLARATMEDPLGGPPEAIPLEDVEALLAEVDRCRLNLRHHHRLVGTARDAAANVRRRLGPDLAEHVNSEMRRVGAELGDLEERTN